MGCFFSQMGKEEKGVRSEKPEINSGAGAHGGPVYDSLLSGASSSGEPASALPSSATRDPEPASAIPSSAKRD